jgi:hypothetical protein
MRAPVADLVVRVDEGQAAALRHAAVDLALATGATHLRIVPQIDKAEVEVRLAGPGR